MMLSTAEHKSFLEGPGEAAEQRLRLEKDVSLLYFKLRAILFLNCFVWSILHSIPVHLGDPGSSAM